MYQNYMYQQQQMYLYTQQYIAMYGQPPPGMGVYAYPSYGPNMMDMGM